ncbi:HlyD family secretion protein [Alphaproteobacteria bacterium]|nr:HlyD family secretion protein [Alphaproteobacteria bacterium]
MKFSINFLNHDKLFWFLILFLGLIIAWSLTFKLDKSINIEGEIKPLGKPLIVQSRFEGKVIEIHVKGGQELEKGEKFITFETDIDESEMLEIDTNIITTSITVKRLENQLVQQIDLNFNVKKEPYKSANGVDVIGILDEQQQALSSELIALDSELKLVDSEKQVKYAEIKVHDSSVRAIKSKLEISDKKYSLMKKLFDKGYEGEIALMEASSEVILAQKELSEVETQLELTKNELLLLDDKYLASLGEFRRKTIAQLNEQKEELRLLKVRKNGLEARIKEYFVKAPVDGVLSKLMAENTGQVFSQGDTLAEIIPANIPLVFYGKIPVQHIDEIKLGQVSKVLPSTFDSRTQKALLAKIIEVAPDATTPDNEKPFYSVVLKFDEMPNKSNAIRAGITGSGSLLLGERTVFDYYFEPLLSVFRGALSE